MERSLRSHGLNGLRPTAALQLIDYSQEAADELNVQPDYRDLGLGYPAWMFDLGLFLPPWLGQKTSGVLLPG